MKTKEPTSAAEILFRHFGRRYGKSGTTWAKLGNEAKEGYIIAALEVLQFHGIAPAPTPLKPSKRNPALHRT